MRSLADRGDAQMLVRVRPAEAFAARPRLFSALERAFAVRFVPGDEPAPEPALISLVANASAGGSNPSGPGSHSLHFLDASRLETPTRIELARTNTLAAALRGVALSENQGVVANTRPPEGRVEILAGTASGPLWTRREKEQWTVLAPDELEHGLPLREQLRDGRFFGLLPLVHWLDALAPPPTWQPPPLRATFLFDDPNLHWPTYGFVRYRDLARHANEHRYAATMAIIPRDLWFTHPGAARLFRESQGLLSLALHGNDHVKRELERPLSDEARRSLLGQAVRRAAAFESRWGVPIARIMVPPHGSTSREMALDMPPIGIEAMSDSRPYPWLRQAPADKPLAGWRFVDVVDGGLPVIPRYHFTRSRDDLPLRAFLGHPLILYGHHDDVSPGLEYLAEAAAEVNALGQVRWGPLRDIARTNFVTRRTGSCLEVRLFNSVIDLDIPDGVEEVVVHAHDLGPVTTVVAARASTTTTLPFASGVSDSLRVTPGSLNLRTIRADDHDPLLLASPRVRVWPLLRRVASEARDRALPAMHRARRS